MKDYIDTELNRLKKNGPTRSDFQEVNSIEEKRNSLHISETEYETPLSISDDNDFQVHLKRPPNLCFINNHFAKRLLAWEANLDIQPCLTIMKQLCTCVHIYRNQKTSTTNP